ncbi:MAG TPA: hypothetical protein DGG95_06330 [Cytophagales bacterium]|jgi:hypothetical protein|nr:hypothetical protein [Cytophagales bacterium]
MIDIKDTILKFLKLDSLIASLSGYLESKVDLLKLEVREELIKVVSRGLMVGVYFLLGMLFLVFFSFGLANYLGERMNSIYSGYWIVSAGYALIGIILIFFRHNISRFLESHLKNQLKHKAK